MTTNKSTDRSPAGGAVEADPLFDAPPPVRNRRPRVGHPPGAVTVTTVCLACGQSAAISANTPEALCLECRRDLPALVDRLQAQIARLDESGEAMTAAFVMLQRALPDEDKDRFAIMQAKLRTAEQAEQKAATTAKAYQTDETVLAIYRQAKADLALIRERVDATAANPKNTIAPITKKWLALLADGRALQEQLTPLRIALAQAQAILSGEQIPF